jgi:hypothetical protein
VASTGVSTRHAGVRALLLLAAAGLLVADDVTKTERLDFPSGGTLHLKNSIGELTVEGWDQPGIEITTIKSPRNPMAQLDRVQVKAERQKDEVVVTTAWAKNDFDLEYRIKAPRAARLVIEHKSGEVHIDGITGELRVTDHNGQITVHVPQDGQYAIDARAKLGAIDSDFPGREERKLKFGHAFASQGSSAGQKMYLRIGFGDITILAMRIPQNLPAPAKK